jgi:hypothetical protein
MYNEMMASRARAQTSKDEERQASLLSLPPLMDRAERGDVVAMQRIAAVFAEYSGVQLIEGADLRAGQAHYSMRRRAAIVTPIVDLPTLAVALHEIGHGAIPKCPDLTWFDVDWRSWHVPGTRGYDEYAAREQARKTHFISADDGCVGCEVAAWEAALNVLPLPFTRSMFKRLQEALGTYRSGKATPDSLRALDNLVKRST